MVRYVEEIVDQKHQWYDNHDAKDDLYNVPGPQHTIGVVAELNHVQEKERGSEPVKHNDGKIKLRESVQVLSSNRNLGVLGTYICSKNLLVMWPNEFCDGRKGVIGNEDECPPSKIGPHRPSRSVKGKHCPTPDVVFFRYAGSVVMKKVLIIGSNGWLASRLASMLKERKGDSLIVRGFDILPCRQGVAVDEFVQGRRSDTPLLTN